MSKRPYVVTARRVVEFFDRHPDWNSIQIGLALGLHHGYVRKALLRNGRKLRLARRRRGPAPLKKPFRDRIAELTGERARFSQLLRQHALR